MSNLAQTPQLNIPYWGGLEQPKQALNLNCFDCNNLLQDCTCIEDTIDMKQETLEEVAKKYANDWEEIHPELNSEDISPIAVSKIDFIEGAKWQMERSYSEEEVLVMLSEVRKGSMVTSLINNRTYWDFDIKSEKKWFEQFKKK